MAYVAKTLCFVAALLLIYQKTATCDFLSPIFDHICKAVVCGKGKCKASSNATFKYECECDNGWKQLDHNLKYLPCVVPNCTLDLSCGGSGSPTLPPTPPKDNNASFFDGYSNFMNIATLPCVKQCALGLDCLNPGIRSNSSANASSSSPPALPDSSKNQGSIDFQDSIFLSRL
ncbi:hypothetical protein HA466_0135190 [Hirschfeldia incana]|nr:hypothetical protein HA466_0135190 [Hirschfeldia incana]